jgi:hypothetical protein
MLNKLRNNLNTGFYNNLDTNFEQALNMSERDFSHEEMLNLLKNGNIPEKQIAALKLDSVNNLAEAEVLVGNLTGCDGKIREAVALKINSLLNKDSNFSCLFNQAEVFANASIDINANICRLVIDSVAILKKDSEFSKKYLNKILVFIDEAFAEIDKFIFRDKKYVINKQLFKLYWALEALNLYAEELDLEVLLPILDRAIKEREYTIREKVAIIVKKQADIKFEQLREKLLNDENYYVRNAISN